VSYYSELFNRSGKAIRIEDCHTSPTHPDIASDGSVICPMNMYRAGGDIKASFGSIIGEIYSTIEWNDRKKPLSFPGCWAYPDMMQVGNFHGEEPLRSAEERTHFSLWVVNSAPVGGPQRGDDSQSFTSSSLTSLFFFQKILFLTTDLDVYRSITAAVALLLIMSLPRSAGARL
jgi:hypothetical protein